MAEDPDMNKLIKGLAEEMGRLPTEDEVMKFIFGGAEDRKEVLSGSVRNPDS